jgi:hypothetical protein
LNTLNIGKFLILVSFLPLSFLIYTVLNLESLKITIAHPRVFVELAIFIALISFGLILVIQKINNV